MDSERPEILLLSLMLKDFFDESYTSLINSLHKVAEVKRAQNAGGAIRYLEANNNPRAIIVTDEGLTKAANKAVLERVKTYAQNGGRVIIGLHFTCFTNMNVFNNFFGNALGLHWRSGAYHRATFEFNPSCTLPAGVSKDSFPSKYSMKVLHIKNAEQQEKIFAPVTGATVESLVFQPSPVDETQAAVVGAKYGEGFLVYAGDVNPGEDSDKVILALLGF